MKNEPKNNEIRIYQTDDGRTRIDARFEGETVWLSQKIMAALFEVDVRTINEHLQNIFASEELGEDAVIRNFRITATDGKMYDTKHYNLDAIISVGYRVNSATATRFRIWATERLREYIIKGFTMNDEKLKDPYNIFGKDYFEEQKNMRSLELNKTKIIFQTLTAR